MERGLQTSGINLIGVGDIVDDEVLNHLNDSMLGTVTTLQYSAAHPSETNKAFVAGFMRATRWRPSQCSSRSCLRWNAFDL